MRAGEQAEFTDRVGNIDVGVAVRQLAERAQRGRSGAAPPVDAGDPPPRSGWRGTKIVRSPGTPCLQPTVRLDHFPLLARMGGSGDEDLALADSVLHFESLVGSAGGAGTSSLRLPVLTILGTPSSGVARGIKGRLREAEVEPAEQARRVRGSERQRWNERSDMPAVDQDQRNARAWRSP